MKSLCLIFLFLIGQNKNFGQLPEISHNYSKLDSIENPLIDSFQNKFDFIIAYSEQSYWWSDKKNYRILAYNNDELSLLTYTSYFKKGAKKKRKKYLNNNQVKNENLFFLKSVFNSSETLKLLSDLKNNDFWKLNYDSLNQTRMIETRIENGDTVNRKAIIDDGINYRFDIITKGKLRVIESYEPEYFLELFPDMIDRRKFITCRDLFLVWWKNHSQ